MNLSKIKTEKGFTLIEILLVVALIAILAVVVFAALDPATRFEDTRDARRASDVNTYLTAIHEYIVDNEGELPDGLTDPMSAASEVGTCAPGSGVASADCSAAPSTTGDCVDLETSLSDYLSSAPVDPQADDGTNTGYAVRVDNGQVFVYACNAEGTTITASR